MINKNIYQPSIICVIVIITLMKPSSSCWDQVKPIINGDFSDKVSCISNSKIIESIIYAASITSHLINILPFNAEELDELSLDDVEKSLELSRTLLNFNSKIMTLRGSLSSCIDKKIAIEGITGVAVTIIATVAALGLTAANVGITVATVGAYAPAAIVTSAAAFGVSALATGIGGMLTLHSIRLALRKEPTLNEIFDMNSIVNIQLSNIIENLKLSIPYKISNKKVNKIMVLEKERILQRPTDLVSFQKRLNYYSSKLLDCESYKEERKNVVGHNINLIQYNDYLECYKFREEQIFKSYDQHRFCETIKVDFIKIKAND